ncbi:hypothetical protein [Microbacterium candidum]|uniref:Uncharacterized protein n=1 Tax=Microbacterium candidum TaxID=3041922 RepID=A0ABT7N067_9MICO|nr:hypothetical protein [Microbacterium sp. ASV49]MDL9980103.1 hypothetical protein [Microbacterium sp. ASV49]
MSEFEPNHSAETRPAPERASPDWRRFEVARDRWLTRIADGIAEAMATHAEIDLMTARCIAHVVGRAYGRESALADFGRTGEGSYLALRDEYLDIYSDARADAITKEWIDWLGTFLVQREKLGSGRQFMNEHLPPKLERLLVATGVEVGDWYFTVHVPASLDGTQIEGLQEELTNLRLDEDEALQAYLSLPDVDANTDMLMESFHENFVATFTSSEDAVHGLCEIDEWEKEVNEFAAERGLFIDQYSVDYEALHDRLRDGYDLVEWKDHVHVFYK